MKYFRIVAFIFITAFSSQAFAQTVTQTTQTATTQIIQAKPATKKVRPMPVASPGTPSGLSLGIEAYDYSYEEPRFAWLDGTFFGLDLTYTHKFGTTKKYFYTFNADGDIGWLDYKSNGTGTDDGILNLKADLRALLGRDFFLTDHFAVSPYAGIAYRTLYDNGAGTVTTTGAIGYDRLSRYLYVPVGLSLGYTVGDWTIRPSAEYDRLIWGEQTSRLGRAGFTPADIDNKQDSGYGIRASLMFETPTSRGLLSFGPFVRYWDIDDSDRTSSFAVIGGVPGIYSFMEPANTTTEIGAMVKLSF